MSIELLCADIVDELVPGGWYELQDTKLNEHFPEPPPPGITGPRSVIDAWSGAVFDTHRNRLIVWGGGHCDYSGNEIYAFDLQSTSWSRLTEPSENVVEGVSHYPDGTPSARHTYNTIAYAASQDALVSVAAAGYFCKAEGRYERAMDLYDFEQGKWIRGDDFPDIGSSIGALTVYDTATDRLWAHGTYGNGQLASYSFEAQKWKVHGGARYLQIDGSPLIDTKRNRLVIVGGWGQQRTILVWNLKRPGADPRTPKTSGAIELESEKGFGFAYDSLRDKYVAWNGGRTVFTLDPESWTWTKTVGSLSEVSAPPAANPNGTYGRFQFVPSLGAFIVVNRADRNVYLYTPKN